MVSKNNKRVWITLSKRQANWLETNAKKLNISVSKLIKFLIDKNAAKMIEILRLKGISIKDLEELIRIAKTPWIDEGE